MPTILLIRHGENDYLKQGRLPGRLPGIHLNDKGRAQAQAVAELLAPKLKEAPVKGIFCSPLERAAETAAPLGAALGLPVIQREGLMETDCGQWTGKTLKGLRRLKMWKIVQQSPSQFQFPGGESFAASQKRIVAELESLGGQGDPKEVVICVLHADPIKLAVAHVLGLPLDYFQRLTVGPASITALEYAPQGGRLLALNVEPVLSLPSS